MKIRIKFKTAGKTDVVLHTSLHIPVTPPFQFGRCAEHLPGSSALFLVSLRQRHKNVSPSKRIVFRSFAA